MEQDIDAILRRLTSCVASAIGRDAQLRAELKGVAQSLIDWLDGQGAAAAAAAASGDLAPAAPEPDVRDVKELPPAPVAVPAPTVQKVLRLGNAEVRVAAAPPLPAGPILGPRLVSPAPAESAAGSGEPEPAGGPAEEFDLPLLQRRFALKARACAWAAERRRRADAGATVGASAPDAELRELYDEAKALRACYLWMVGKRFLGAGGPALPADVLALLAGVYDCVARAIDAVAWLDGALGGADAGTETGADESGAAVQAWFLLAEAQSALRVALSQADVTDYDQRGLFGILRRHTNERGLFIPRHMTLDDPADPANWPDLQKRIDGLRGAVEQRRAQRARRKSLLDKARYHATRAAADAHADGGGGAAAAADDEPNLHDWRKLAEAVDRLVEGGLPPSDVQFRRLLLPLMDDFPDAQEIGAGSGLQAVLDEIDRYQAAAAVEDERREDAGPAGRRASPTVLAARDWLAGRTALLLGGLARPQQQRKLAEGLNLAALRWVSVQHHQSLEDEFLHQVRKPEVSVVLAMTRWRSHQFGPQVRQWCKQFGKTYVELPAGYGVEQVAFQIARQAGDELSGERQSLPAAPAT